MFSNVLNATLRILLFRGGPQDLPFAPNLMPLLLAAAGLANRAASRVGAARRMRISLSTAPTAGLYVTEGLMRKFD